MARINQHARVQGVAGDMTSDNARRFILWDPADGSPIRRGEFVSAGIIGEVGSDNVYLTAYATWPDERRPGDLDPGQCITGVRFSLSGTSGCYDVWRVS